VKCGAIAVSRQASSEAQHFHEEEKKTGVLSGMMKDLTEAIKDTDEMLGDEHGEVHDFRIYVHIFNGVAPKGMHSHVPNREDREEKFYVTLEYDHTVHSTAVRYCCGLYSAAASYCTVLLLALSLSISQVASLDL
jgi:hypothetical protein